MSRTLRASATSVESLTSPQILAYAAKSTPTRQSLQPTVDTAERPMPPFPEPSPANDFLAAHIARLQASLRHWTGRELTDQTLPLAERARRVFEAPFAVLSHDAAADPVFTYVNRTAMTLWEMGWTDMTRLPSRLSAEPMERTARARFLADVKARGFVEGYEGVRMSRSGRRFRIRDALLWNLLDETGQLCGQAALFRDWQFLR